jgi:hypothetical protein
VTRFWKSAAAAVGMVCVALLQGCGGGAHFNEASLRLVNASSGYDSLDLYIDDSLTSSAVASGTGGGYVNVGTSVDVALTRSGGTTQLVTLTGSYEKRKHYTLLAYGAVGSIKTLQIAEDVGAPASGKTLLQIASVAPDAGSLDLYLIGSGDELIDAAPVASSLASGAVPTTVTVNSGTRRLVVTAAGSKTDVRLDLPSVTLGSRQVQTLAITAGSGGLLVNVLQIEQQGAVTLMAGTQALVRAIASVSGAGSVTVSVGGTPLLAGALAPSVGAYSLVPSGSTEIVASVAGSSVVPVPVPSPAPTFSAGVEYTLLIWGDAASPQMTLIADDNRLPTVSTNANLRQINAVTGLADPLSMTAALLPVATAVGPGQASAQTGVTAGSDIRIEVRSTTSALFAPDPATVTLAAGRVYSVLVNGTAASPQGQIITER